MEVSTAKRGGHEDITIFSRDRRDRYHAAVATMSDGQIGGLVSWRFDAKPRHGELYLLAVSEAHRRQQIGRRLCEHAIDHLRAGEVEVLQVNTGGDVFHAPARALYDALGFTQVPVCAYLRTA